MGKVERKYFFQDVGRCVITFHVCKRGNLSCMLLLYNSLRALDRGNAMAWNMCAAHKAFHVCHVFVSVFVLTYTMAYIYYVI